MIAARKSPFTQEALNQIFTVSAKYPDRLLSRESERLEFKESFGFASLGKYIRSAAGFANAKGGYIVYGVGNSPHILHGLKNDVFDQLDPEKLTSYLSEHFDPEIHWERQLYELSGKIYGLLYFCESDNKPVVCRKTADDGKNLKEGEIYYRYRGRTQTIRYPELKAIIEERRRDEQQLWLKHLSEIARIGVRDLGLLDLRSGTVSGACGSFLIEESLLSQVAFIREGEFNEVKGRPAIKIIGSAQPIGMLSIATGGSPRIVRQKGIRAPDIILGFLRTEKVDDPLSYLTQIAFETTAFLPCYFYMEQARLTLASARTLVAGEPSTSAAKVRLLNRLDSHEYLGRPLPSKNSISGQRKLDMRNSLLGNSLPSVSEGRDLTDLLDVILTLRCEEIDERRFKCLLLDIFNRHYARDDRNLNDRIRRAICYLDACLCLPKIPAPDAVPMVLDVAPMEAITR